MAFTATNQLRIDARLTGPGDLGTDTATLQKTYLATIANGTGTGQADGMFKDTRSLATGGTEDLDLNTILAPFGSAFNPAELVTILIESASTNTTNLTIGGSAADYTGLPDQTIAPGGIVYLNNLGANGLGAVTNGSSDIIRVTNAAGATASYEIFLIGRSA